MMYRKLENIVFKQTIREAQLNGVVIGVIHFELGWKQSMVGGATLFLDQNFISDKQTIST